MVNSYVFYDAAFFFLILSVLGEIVLLGGRCIIFRELDVFVEHRTLNQELLEITCCCGVKLNVKIFM